MACVIALVVLLVIAFLAGPWVLLGLQYRRAREQGTRLDDLQRELLALRTRFDRATAAAPGMAEAVPSSSPAVAESPPPVTPMVPVTPVVPSIAPPLESEREVAIGAPPPPPSPPSGSGAGATVPPAGGASKPMIDWERWIGVRGAAVLGGIVLALAGILFVRYSIERGLISPALRVAMGIVAGIGAIGWSQRLRVRGYRINADALAGAGIVLLYAAVWASHSLYGFIGPVVAYGLMSLITLACGVLSWRNASLLIAVMGLVGGFATPFLIATDSESPLGLFGYVLLLDLGLIALARRRGWSSLAVLAVIGTVFYQAFWVFTRLTSDNTWTTLVILALFAVVFGLARWSRARDVEEKPRRGWALAEGAGLLVPFALALEMASRADLGEHLYPVAGLLLILSVMAQWIARRNAGGDMLASGAAAGSLAVVLVWSWDVAWTPALVWELIAVCVALAAAFHVFFELDLRAGRAAGAPRATSLSILVAEIGFLGLLILNAFSSLDSPWPWVAGFVAVSALLVRLSVDPARAFTPMVAAAGIAGGMSGWFLIAAAKGVLPALSIYFGVVLLLGAVFQALALLRTDERARRYGELAAALYAAIVLVGLLFTPTGAPLEAPLFLLVSMLLGVLFVLPATRLGEGAGYLAGLMILAFVNTAWCVRDTAKEHALLWLVVDAIAAIAFALWPSFAPRLARSRVAWRAAALSGPAWFFAMGRMYSERFGDGSIGLLPLALAAVTLAAAYRGRRVWPAEEAQAQTGHLAWFGAIVLGFAAIAVPLQLDKEWITVGWALEGRAVTALWKRLDHPGLKYFGAALFAAVTVRLLLNPEVLTYHERSGMPILNWLAYTYLVPAACLLGAASILGRAATVAASPSLAASPAGDDSAGAALEVARARPWESLLYGRKIAVIAGGAVTAAILVVFAWINLTIFDAFGTGSILTLSMERMPARDLTLSLAWVVYAVTLLGFGMARDSSALRWLSLGFLVLSIGKVFLYDLGELRDLYRVASLVGLAVSLILVSLAYQRFVFRRRADEDAA